MRRGPAAAGGHRADKGRQEPARARAITGGDEIVPTVVVGTQAMINPSARQVIAALEAGGTLPVQGPSSPHHGSRGQPASHPPLAAAGHAVDELGGPAPG